MTKRQEFADKWGYQTGEGYGGALFDCRKTLLKDLDVLIADEVKNLALPHVMQQSEQLHIAQLIMGIEDFLEPLHPIRHSNSFLKLKAMCNCA